MRFTTVAAIVVCAVNASIVADADTKARGRDAVVTVTGCLERNGDALRLVDTRGPDVPTARSWKSGFLKRRPADLDVVDASRKLKLQNHVGHRIAVTGRVQDGEIEARSMRHLAASCGH
jgi:hypothetical protein